MKIVADECVDEEIVSRLRSDGHEVGYVAEMSPGILDEDVLVLANEEDTLLVTADKDFGELVYRQGLVRRGILLYRLAELAKTERAEIISTVISHHGDELLASFSVLTGKAIRIRKV
jgi:predicted nuclease of predicted toxin-antitoxin system